MYYQPKERVFTQEEVQEIVFSILEIHHNTWTKLEAGMENEFQKLDAELQKLENENARLKHLVGKLLKQRSISRLLKFNRTK